VGHVAQKKYKVIMSALDFSVKPKYRQSTGEIMGKKNISEEKIIFVRFFRHWRTGKMVYPKNGKVIALKLKRKPKK